MSHLSPEAGSSIQNRWRSPETNGPQSPELRYFGGFSIEEAAAVLGVSVDTVKRDRRMAKAWPSAELARSS